MQLSSLFYSATQTEQKVVMETPEINENCYYYYGQHEPRKCKTKLEKFHFDILCHCRVIKESLLVHVSNFEGVAGSEDFACATLPTTPIDFQAKVLNSCHPTLPKVRFKISVTPPRPPKKRAKSILWCFNKL